MLDTPPPVCKGAPSVAPALGLKSGNTSGQRAYDVVGGDWLSMDMHCLQSLRVGSAEAYNILIAVAKPGPALRFALLGMSFMERFGTTTVDLNGDRVVFRAKRGR